MNIQDYIKSGILEQYCLNMLNEKEQADVQKNCSLFPEIKNELTVIETAIEKYAIANAIVPNAQLKYRILKKLSFGDIIDLKSLPVIDANSNYLDWLAAVEPLIPNEPFDAFFAKTLRDNDKVAQTLVITSLNVPEEQHEDRIESFFILKGKCECTVGDEVFTLQAGNFLEVPLHITHDIKIQSPYVIAILQECFL